MVDIPGSEIIFLTVQRKEAEKVENGFLRLSCNTPRDAQSSFSMGDKYLSPYTGIRTSTSF